MTDRKISASGIALCVAACAAAPASAQSSQRYDVAGFDSISVRGAYELDVAVGESYSVVVSGPQDRVRDARIRVDSGRLVLAEADCRNCSRNGSLHARITLPRLDALDVAGVAGDSRISGIAADDFRIDVSGVAEFELSGRCGRLSLTAQGVADINGRNLRCRDAVANLEGVGESIVFASGRLDADVDGMAELIVYGSPQIVEEHTGGFGHVTVR